MITWKLPGYDLVTAPDEPEPAEENADGEDLLGGGSKAVSGSGDPSLNVSGKFDERQSLLTDGMKDPINKNPVTDKSLSDSQQAARVTPEGLVEGTQEAEVRPVTKKDIYKRREEILDKALISAVKTLA